jgi:hypothetical protein
VRERERVRESDPLSPGSSLYSKHLSFYYLFLYPLLLPIGLGFRVKGKVRIKFH